MNETASALLLGDDVTEREIDVLRAELSPAVFETFVHYRRGTVPAKVWLWRCTAAVLLLVAGGGIGAYIGRSTLADPADESASFFVCHNGETDVPIETACARIEEANGAAGARRALTSVKTAYSCLPQYRLHVRPAGADASVAFPYHAEVDIEQPNPSISMAMVILHGAGRDADNCEPRSLVDTLI